MRKNKKPMNPILGISILTQFFDQAQTLQVASSFSALAVYLPLPGWKMSCKGTPTLVSHTPIIPIAPYLDDPLGHHKQRFPALVKRVYHHRKRRKERPDDPNHNPSSQPLRPIDGLREEQRERDQNNHHDEQGDATPGREPERALQCNGVEVRVDRDALGNVLVVCGRDDLHVTGVHIFLLIVAWGVGAGSGARSGMSWAVNRTGDVEREVVRALLAWEFSSGE